MKLSLIPALCLLGSAISAPVRFKNQQLAKRDGKLVQMAWADIGAAYVVMENAIKAAKPNTPNAIYQSGFPTAHTNIMNLYRQTADAFRGAPQISMSEGSALLLPAQTLTNKQVSALNAIVKAKPLTVQSRERYQVYQSLNDQMNAYIQWSAVLNKIMPSFQKGAGQSAANNIIEAYKTATSKYQFDV